MKQMTPQEAIDKLIALCPCEIRYGDTTRNFYSSMGSPHIVLSTHGTVHRQIAALAHEVGHAVCDSNNCNCVRCIRLSTRNHSQLFEYHASMFSLTWLLDNELMQSLYELANCIRDIADNRFDSETYYRESAAKIIKTELYQGCLDACGADQPYALVGDER